MSRLIMRYLLSNFWSKIERYCYNNPPSYLPDIAPCHFWLFPKYKSALRGIHFELVEAVKTKFTEVLKTLQKRISNILSTIGKYRWSDVLSEKLREEKYTKGEKCIIIKNCFKNFLVSFLITTPHI